MREYTLRDKYFAGLCVQATVIRYRRFSWRAVCDRHSDDNFWVTAHPTHAEAFAAALAHAQTHTKELNNEHR